MGGRLGLILLKWQRTAMFSLIAFALPFLVPSGRTSGLCGPLYLNSSSRS